MDTPKKKTGPKPRLNQPCKLSLMSTAWHSAALALYAGDHNISMSEALRYAIEVLTGTEPPRRK